jgi:hypothetical protein
MVKCDKRSSKSIEQFWTSQCEYVLIFPYGYLSCIVM